MVGGLATARAIGLARAVAAAMQLAKLKGTAVVLLAACVLSAGTTSLSYLSPPHEGNTAPSTVQPAQSAQTAPAARPEPPTDVAKNDPKPAPSVEKKVDDPRPQGELQAHPFPQQPAERKAVPTQGDDAAGMMDG